MTTNSSLRYNQVQQLSSHNSYAPNGPKDNIQTQFQSGVRSFELDIHRGRNAGEWKVYHILPFGNFVSDLREALLLFRQIHRANPSHEVITIWLEVKNS